MYSAINGDDALMQNLLDKGAHVNQMVGNSFQDGSILIVYSLPIDIKKILIFFLCNSFYLHAIANTHSVDRCSQINFSGSH